MFAIRADRQRKRELAPHVAALEKPGLVEDCFHLIDSRQLERKGKQRSLISVDINQNTRCMEEGMVAASLAVRTRNDVRPRVTALVLRLPGLRCRRGARRRASASERMRSHSKLAGKTS